MKEKLKAMFAVSSDDSSEETRRQRPEPQKPDKNLRMNQKKGNKSPRKEKRDKYSPSRVYAPKPKSEMALKEEGKPARGILKGPKSQRNSKASLKFKEEQQPRGSPLTLSKSVTNIETLDQVSNPNVPQKKNSEPQLIETKNCKGDFVKGNEVITLVQTTSKQEQSGVQDSNQNIQNKKLNEKKNTEEIKEDETEADDEINYNYEKELEELTNEREKITETMNFLEEKINKIIFSDEDIQVAEDSESKGKGNAGRDEENKDQQCPDTEYLQRLHKMVDHNTEESQNCSKECYQKYLSRRVDMLKEKIISLKDSLDECKVWIRDEMESINTELERKVTEPPPEIQVYQTAVEVTEQVTEIREFTSNQRPRKFSARMRDLSCGDPEASVSLRPRKHDWELERFKAKRDHAAAHYMHKLFEVDLLCQHEMAKLEQNVSRLVPLSRMASEWQGPSPNEVGDAGTAIGIKH